MYEIGVSRRNIEERSSPPPPTHTHSDASETPSLDKTVWTFYEAHSTTGHDTARPAAQVAGTKTARQQLQGMTELLKHRHT
jgi:hypothetical protein